MLGFEVYMLVAGIEDGLIDELSENICHFLCSSMNVKRCEIHSTNSSVVTRRYWTSFKTVSIVALSNQDDLKASREKRRNIANEATVKILKIEDNGTSTHSERCNFTKWE
jgi:hypothetical protein